MELKLEDCKHLLLNTCKCFFSLFKKKEGKKRNIIMKYLRLWRRASSILQCDLPRLALAGRSYQRTRQAYALYMLRDKIRRRGFSDKTVKDYLSFGGLVVICYQNGFCGGGGGMTGMER